MWEGGRDYQHPSRPALGPTSLSVREPDFYRRELQSGFFVTNLFVYKLRLKEE
jgi:hypothetical protein